MTTTKQMTNEEIRQHILGGLSITGMSFAEVVDVLNKVLEPVFLGKRNAEDVFTSDVLNNFAYYCDVFCCFRDTVV